MESYLQITYLNDFIFCPLSIYYHELYGQQEPLLYKDSPQINGTAAHESIDSATYSTHKDVLQGVDVFSTQLNLCGKIDTFDIAKGVLTERKKHIQHLYDGYVFQLYAQYYCLYEVGYDVNKLRFWSKDDNKVFPVPLPDENLELKEKFFHVIHQVRIFDPATFVPTNASKCSHCIYNPFCDRPC